VVAAIIRGIPPDLLEQPSIFRGRPWIEVVDRNCTRELLEAYWDEKDTRSATRTIILDLVEIIRTHSEGEQGGRDLFAERFQELCGLFGLSEIEVEVLLLCHLLEAKILEPPMRARKTDELRKLDKLLPWLDKSPQVIRKALAEDQKLRKYNCIDGDFDFNTDLNDFLYGWSDEPLVHSFYSRMKGDPLPWAYFGALAEKHGEILKDLIRQRNPKRGVNILLYGAPGSGKTCFAQSLAAELGLSCYGVAQDVKNDNTARTCSTPDFRFGALRLCDERVDREKSIVIVDEADEMLKGFMGGGALIFALLGGEPASSGDKGLLNSVLDEIKTPCIWISNTPARMLDPSSRRRFDYSIRFDKLSAGQRRAIWKNNVEKFKLEELFPRSCRISWRTATR
jgi:transitional endoplasmic reticulum ATPase